jgi:hypothetical protein
MEHLQTTASPSDRRQTIEYLRRKARSIELQAARAAPIVAAQLKSLAELMEVEAEQLERMGTIQQATLQG